MNSFCSNKEYGRKENIFYTEIYNNHTLMSDILFNFLIGFYNLGVNCFFNCGLHLILHSYRFIIELIDDINYNMYKNAYQSNNISNSFIEFCRQIINKFLSVNNIYMNNSNKVNIDKIKQVDFDNKINSNISISPKTLLETFTNMHPRYKNSEEDAVEFIRVLLNDLSTENNFNKSNHTYKELSYKGKTKSEISREYHNNYVNKQSSAVIINFYFQIANTYICTCGYESYSFDKYLDLPLLFPEDKKEFNLLDLIKFRFNSSVKKWIKKCEGCKESNINHYKIEKFDMIANYIIIYTQRINRFLNSKNDSKITFSEFLNLNEFLEDDLKNQNIRLKLLGIIYHIGFIESGHYYVIIKIRDQWFKFNDNEVTEINNKKFESEEACAFLYERYY